MIITKEMLEEMNACNDGVSWFEKTFPKGASLKTAAKEAIKQGHFDFANWFITKKLQHEDKVGYAIYAAELVLDIFEAKYPDDDRPRKAIEAAKNYLKTQAAADAAAYAAAYAADAEIKTKIINYGVDLIINHTLVWGSIVLCETCQARTSPGRTDEEAIKRWNTRHHSEELLDMVEGKE